MIPLPKAVRNALKKMGKDAPHTRRCVDLNDSSCYEMPCICEEAEN